jgi:hypothetical protein
MESASLYSRYFGGSLSGGDKIIDFLHGAFELPADLNGHDQLDHMAQLGKGVEPFALNVNMLFATNKKFPNQS